MTQVWDHLQNLMTEPRREKLKKVAARRSDGIRLVLEDVGKKHNISACLRTAEAFGIQHVHILSQKGVFDPSSVTRGVEKWLSLHIHKDMEDLCKVLKDYTFAVAYPRSEGCVSVDDLDISGKLALIFGNEAEGASEQWLSKNPVRFHIPMVGIVESLNISVCCAVSIAVIQRRMQAAGCYPTLTPSEQVELLGNWAADQFPKAAEALGR